MSGDRMNYGLTRNHLTASLRHAVIITIIGLIVIFLLGLWLGFKPLSIDPFWLFFYVVISVPLQEFVFRGFIQTKLYRFGSDESIAMTSILYAAIHFPNPLLIVLTMVAGMVWGYSFYRAPTLLGPTVSHAVLGVALFVLVL